MFTVFFYEKEDGEIPVEEFLLSLDLKHRSKMLGLISILKDYGNRLREPYSKHLDDGIFELRCKIGSNSSRLLYFFYCGERIIITNGFIKKTNKTPTGELRIAKQYRNDYLKREGNQ